MLQQHRLQYILVYLLTYLVLTDVFEKDVLIEWLEQNLTFLKYDVVDMFLQDGHLDIILQR